MPSSPRPVIALDVDGVLSADGPTPGPGWVAHDVHVSAEDLPDSPFLRGYGREALTTRVRLHVDHGRWITSLRERADVVWATTWEQAANVALAPLLGIDPLPVLPIRHVPFGVLRDRDPAFAKMLALTDWVQDSGAPVLWLDDLNGRWARESWLGGRGMAVPVDPAVGLGADHQQLVEDFVSWAAAAGPDEVFAFTGQAPEGSWVVRSADGSALHITTSARGDASASWTPAGAPAVPLADVAFDQCRLGAPLQASGFSADFDVVDLTADRVVALTRA